MEFLDDRYAVFVVKAREKGMEIVLEKVQGLKYIYKFALDMEYTVFISVFSNDISGNGSRIEECRNLLCDSILEQGGYIVGVSEILRNPSMIGLALRQAYEAVSRAYYRTNRKVFNWDRNIGRRLKKEENYKIRFSREMANGNYAKAIRIKEELQEAVKNETPYDVQSVKELYVFLMVTLLHFVKEDIRKLEVRIEGIRREAKETEALGELDQIIDRCFEDSLGSGQKQEFSYAVRMAIEYLEDNYKSQIDLSDVASHVGLSPEYLSRIFKKETGINFVVYLNNIRLKHALKLLENTNLKVYEIAENVGYSNLSYFSTVFKKNFGMNPFEYKKTGDKDNLRFESGEILG